MGCRCRNTVPSTAAKLAKEVLIVTKDELLALAESERKYAEAKKKVSAIEKDLEFQRMQLAEKTLGVKSKDELKQLSPEEVQKLFTKRWERGDWKTSAGAPEFQFVKTSQGRYPAWRDLFIAELGETAAARISADTEITWSYAVSVAAS